MVVPEIQFPIDISGLETEENRFFEFPLVLNQSTTRDITVYFETRPLTAEEDSDYIPVQDSLIVSAGTAAATIAVEIVIDEFTEEDEQFRLVITGTSGAFLVGGVQEAIGTILNDDTLIGVDNTGHVSADSYPGKTLAWSDEFDGDAIDLQNWTYDLGASGWGNQELQNYTSNSENSYVSNGKLFIVAKQEGVHYTSARMKSIGLQEFQHGRIDVRDIMELVGSSPSTVHGTIHFGADWNQHNYVGQGTSLPSGQTFADEFHVFSIEWDESGITWLIDDQPFYSVTSTVTGSQPYPFDNPFFFILNVAVGGQWPGYPDATTTFPQFMAIDYVRIFQ